MTRGLLSFLILVAAVPAFAAEPKFKSPVLDASTPGHAVKIDVDISGAKQLFLVVSDCGDGIGNDWADWAEPRLIGPSGEMKLTDLKWKSATSGWGEVRVNQNASGDRLRINGKSPEYGIGTHADSLIEYDLPPGFTRFQAVGGLDNGGTDQGNNSLQFLVFVEKPTLVAAKPAGNNSGGLTPDESLAALTIGEGLGAKTFASEPMMVSPSNIEVDHLGRVWVADVVNYRGNKGKRPEGDRILVLEDTNGDGVADKSTVFHQGHDIDSLHGLCVIPNVTGSGLRVVVSVGDKVFSLFDDNGDLKSDRKQEMFTGVGGTQHDHGIHAFVFGPDGKFYFNFGNSGNQLKDKEGKFVVDRAGNEIRESLSSSKQAYQQGMVFRCDLDGSNVETLGWNFRNNWEVTVDSFGTIWQSDNDDDGNRGVRINYVMEWGNYGYRDEFTGAGWQVPRTNMETEIPLRHWHLNDPGVVPNLLQTGAGAPTGICVYEGSLLPKVFQNQMLHCDAGPNVCRAYPVKTQGAGYTAETVNILEGSRDKWFRPSDVCVAPDGSLFISDWYDPGVGGHAMKDLDRGRVYRVAPNTSQYVVPKFDVTTVEGAIEALKNSNYVARSLGWLALQQMGAKAEPALLKLFQTDPNPRFRARAFWLLTKLPGDAAKTHLQTGLKDQDADLRITAIRAARQLPVDPVATLTPLLNDPSPAVRRELALSLRDLKAPEAAGMWAKLATQHDGTDRWYLEALGIAANGQWDAYLGAWLQQVGSQWNTPAGRDILWRSRGTVSAVYLGKIIRDPATSTDALPRYFRAFDFLSGEAKDNLISELAFAPTAGDAAKQAYILQESIARLKPFDASKFPERAAAFNKLLEQSKGTAQYVTLVDKFSLHDRYAEILALMQANAEGQLGLDAAKVLLNKGEQKSLQAALANKDAKLAVGTAKALGNSGDGRAVGLLTPIVTGKDQPLELRQEAVRGLGKSKPGCDQLLKLAQAKQIDDSLVQTCAFALHSSSFNDVKAAAATLFPLPPSRNDKPLPPLAQLIKSKGDLGKGKVVFTTIGKCNTCHVVNNEGKEVGPNLSEIGSKLSREAMFESILYPSAGISHNYETYLAVLNNGTTVTGIKISDTPEAVALRGPDALVRTIKRSEIEELVKQPVSLMPADLQKTMTAEELVDVVEYVQSLKKK